MSSSYDINTTFDSLDDSLVSNVIDLDSWTRSLSPPLASNEPVHHSTSRPRQKRHVRTRRHPHPTPAVTLPPVTHSVAAPPVLSTTAVTSSSTQSGVPGRPDKGKGRQTTTPPPSPSGSMDPSVRATSSANLTPEQYVCFVRMLKRLNEWLASGWQPGVDESRLRSLAEIFDSAEAVASGGINNLRLADLAWRLADSEGWEKSAGSSIMGAIDIQVSVTKILYKDYSNTLIDSFRSFLGRKEAELGSRGRPRMLQDRLYRRRRVIAIRNQSFRRGLDSKKWTTQLEELATFAQKGMQEADYLLRRQIPAFLRTMKRAGLSPSTSPLLAQHLTAHGGTSFSVSDSPLPELTPSIPSTLLARSPSFCLSPLSAAANFVTSLPVEEPLPTPTLSEDIGVSDAIPLVTGRPTMTELVEEFMEDLLTQEFSPILLDEDI